MSTGRGRTLLAEVEALERKHPFFGKRGHQEQTVDKMTQCANAFRAERDFAHAGELYLRASRLYQELEDITAAIKTATDSAHMYAKEPSLRAETITAYNFAIELLNSKKKLIDAGDLLAELSKVFAEDNRLDEAVQALQPASDLFKEGNAASKAATVLESVADLLSEKGEAIAAAKFYREVAEIRLANQLTQGSSGPVFFKATILQLQLNDIVGAKAEIEKYLKANPTFRTNQFYKFLDLLISKMEDHDVDGFDEGVAEFKRYNSVDAWLARRLDEIRRYADDDQSLR
jgi:tetratricopeptide (TPR) repeat protein